MGENKREVEVLDDIDTKDERKVKQPPLYAVVFHNDDYTHADYVVSMLMEYFGHSELAAVTIMLDIHQQGNGVAGIFTRDIAETKAMITMNNAKGNGFPLMVTIEPIE